MGVTQCLQRAPRAGAWAGPGVGPAGVRGGWPGPRPALWTLGLVRLGVVSSGQAGAVTSGACLCWEARTGPVASILDLEASPVLSDMFSLTAQSQMGSQTPEGQLGLSGLGDVILLLSRPFPQQGVPAEGP